MIDRVNLHPNETYEFQTDGNHYVVVVNVSFEKVQVKKGDYVLAELERFETYSCPANTGVYTLKNISASYDADVLLVRYILV
jgi:hypothetical protein